MKGDEELSPGKDRIINIIISIFIVLIDIIFVILINIIILIILSIFLISIILVISANKSPRKKVQLSLYQCSRREHCDFKITNTNLASDQFDHGHL